MNMAAPYAPATAIPPMAIAAVVPFCWLVWSPEEPDPNASFESPDEPVLLGLDPSDEVVPLPSRVEPMRMSMAGLIWLVMLYTRELGLVYKAEEGILWSSLSSSTDEVGMYKIACDVMNPSCAVVS